MCQNCASEDLPFKYRRCALHSRHTMGTQQLQRFKPFSLLLSLAKRLLDETLMTIQILVKNFHKQHDVGRTIIVHLLNHFTPLRSSFLQKSKGISKWWMWLHSHNGSPLAPGVKKSVWSITTLGTKLAFKPQTTYSNLCMLLEGGGDHCPHWLLMCSRTPENVTAL